MSNQNKGVMTWDDCVNKKSNYDQLRNQTTSLIMNKLRDPAVTFNENEKKRLQMYLQQLNKIQNTMTNEIGHLLHKLTPNNPIKMDEYPSAYMVESVLSNCMSEINFILEKAKS